MKKVILSVLLLGIIMGLQAQELKVINLNKPDKSRNVTLMQACLLYTSPSPRD